MDTWNRGQLWAEHDAAHARASRLRSFVFIVGLLTVWNLFAVLAHAIGLCPTSASLGPALDERTECAAFADAPCAQR